MSDLKIQALHGHSGRWADLARRIKSVDDTSAINEAARLLAAALIADYPPSWLAPAPSSSGRNNATLELALKVHEYAPDFKVFNIIERVEPRMSAHLARRAGQKPPSIASHRTSMQLVEYVPAGPIVLLDNTATSGSTLKAMAAVIWEEAPSADVRALVLTDGSRGRLRAKNPDRLLRIAVSGSREYPNIEDIAAVIATFPNCVVVHGGARGVDQEAAACARHAGLSTEVWKPDWQRYGRGAGIVRNEEMIRTCDVLIAFWDGKSPGTRSAINIARTLDIDVTVLAPR
jgi:hypothetical protein